MARLSRRGNKTKIGQGTKPLPFYERRKRELVFILNDTATRLESEAVQNTPADTGRLKGGWSIVPASINSDEPVAIVEQSVNHFLPVELGRKPGSGISKEGQKSVKMWAKRVLGISDEKEQSSFAFLLSEKYRKEGRGAAGFLGLAMPGSIPKGSLSDDDFNNPISGSILDDAFKRLRADIRRLEATM